MIYLQNHEGMEVLLVIDNTILHKGMFRINLVGLVQVEDIVIGLWVQILVDTDFLM